MMAQMGTPEGESAKFEYSGLFFAETVNLELGCAHFSLLSTEKSLPFQSLTGVPSSFPSHQGSLLSVRPTLV